MYQYKNLAYEKKNYSFFTSTYLSLQGSYILSPQPLSIRDLLKGTERLQQNLILLILNLCNLS